MQEFICVFIGGGLGSLCRFVIGSHLLKSASHTFPWSTLAANAIGCLLIGLLIGYFERRGAGLLPLLLVTGFCGGFTTFSTFSNETVQLLRQGCYGLSLTYVGISLISGIVLTATGYLLAK